MFCPAPAAEPYFLCYWVRSKVAFAGTRCGIPKKEGKELIEWAPITQCLSIFRRKGSARHSLRVPERFAGPVELLGSEGTLNLSRHIVLNWDKCQSSSPHPPANVSMFVGGGGSVWLNVTSITMIKKILKSCTWIWIQSGICFGSGPNLWLGSGSGPVCLYF